MTENLHQMTSTQLKQYLSKHRNDESAFWAALEVVISRRHPNATYHPYPFDLADPEGEVKAMLVEKIEQSK